MNLPPETRVRNISREIEEDQKTPLDYEIVEISKDYYVNIAGCDEPYNLEKSVSDSLTIPEGFEYYNNGIDLQTQNPQQGLQGAICGATTEVDLPNRKLDVTYYCNNHPSSWCFFGSHGPNAWIGIRVRLIVRRPR